MLPFFSRLWLQSHKSTWINIFFFCITASSFEAASHFYRVWIFLFWGNKLWWQVICIGECNMGPIKMRWDETLSIQDWEMTLLEHWKSMTKRRQKVKRCWGSYRAAVLNKVIIFVRRQKLWTRCQTQTNWIAEIKWVTGQKTSVWAHDRVSWVWFPSKWLSKVVTGTFLLLFFLICSRRVLMIYCW